MDRESYNAYMREHYQKNKEKYLARRKRYKENNRLKINEQKRRRHAKIIGTKTEPVSYEKILEVYGMWCHICQEEIESKTDLHMDHVIPLSKGGTHTYTNIKPSHALCNMQKTDQILEV